jgi:hypothetical protein
MELLDGLNIILFRTSTCPLCPEAKQRFREMKASSKDKRVRWIEVDPTKDPPMAARFYVSSVPQLIITIIRDGEAVYIQAGGNEWQEAVQRGITQINCMEGHRPRRLPTKAGGKTAHG